MTFANEERQNNNARLAKVEDELRKVAQAKIEKIEKHRADALERTRKTFGRILGHAFSTVGDSIHMVLTLMLHLCSGVLPWDFVEAKLGSDGEIQALRGWLTGVHRGTQHQPPQQTSLWQRFRGAITPVICSPFTLVRRIFKCLMTNVIYKVLQILLDFRVEGVINIVLLVFVVLLSFSVGIVVQTLVTSFGGAYLGLFLGCIVNCCLSALSYVVAMILYRTAVPGGGKLINFELLWDIVTNVYHNSVRFVDEVSTQSRVRCLSGVLSFFIAHAVNTIVRREVMWTLFIAAGTTYWVKWNAVTLYLDRMICICLFVALLSSYILAYLEVDTMIPDWFSPSH